MSVIGAVETTPGENALLAIGLFELCLRGIWGDVEEIVEFSLDDEQDTGRRRGEVLTFP